MIILAALFGAVGRVVYGSQYKYWSALLLLPLGFFAADQDNAVAAGLVSVAAFLSFNPGHGSYMDAGQSINPDNEMFAPILKHVLTDGTVLYDCVGLGLRYLLSTCFIAAVMTGCNFGLETAYSLWAAPYGAVVGLFGAVKSWQAKEGIIGAVTYGAVAWAS